MPDIQMCDGMQWIDGLGLSGSESIPLTCHVKDKCYRYIAKVNNYQAWGPPAPDFKPESGCSNFMEGMG